MMIDAIMDTLFYAQSVAIFCCWLSTKTWLVPK